MSVFTPPSLYSLRVVNTSLSKPSAFASTVTRETTDVSDVHGVWQKDRGGKFNNYLCVDLEVQDAFGNAVPLDFFVDVECALRIVMENGDFGGVLDVVNRSSKWLMNKHLEGQSAKLIVIDADPNTGSGIRIGGSSRTSIKVRINELSKKGSKNSRYSVCFQPTGPGSELFNLAEDTKLSASLPLTIYSKVVKTTNYFAAMAAAAAAAAEEEEERALAGAPRQEDGESIAVLSPDASETPLLPMALLSQRPQLHSSSSGGSIKTVPSNNSSKSTAASSAAAAAAAAAAVASAAAAAATAELEQVKLMLDQVMQRLGAVGGAIVAAPTEHEVQMLASIFDVCNAIQRKVETRIRRAPTSSSSSSAHSLESNVAVLSPSSTLTSPPPAPPPPPPPALPAGISQLERDLMMKIPLTSAPQPPPQSSSTTPRIQPGQLSSFPSLDNSWIGGNSSGSSQVAPWSSTAMPSMFASSTAPPPPAAAAAADELIAEKRMRMTNSSAFQNFLTSMPQMFSNSAYASLTGGDLSKTPQQQQQLQHVLRSHASSSTGSVADFENLKTYLEAKVDSIGSAAASSGENFSPEGLTTLFSSLAIPLTDEVRDWMFDVFDFNRDRAVSVHDIRRGYEVKEQILMNIFSANAVNNGFSLAEMNLAKQRQEPWFVMLLAEDAGKLEEAMMQASAPGGADRVLNVREFVSICLDSPRWDAVRSLLEVLERA